MYLGDEKRTVSIMLYSTRKLRELWGELDKQLDIANERFKKINEDLEETRSNLKPYLSKNSKKK
jgi:hypothetical protein